MAANSFNEDVEVYPHDIQQLLMEHSKYPDADSISWAAYLIDLTEENHEALKQELSSMKELYSKLESERYTSDVGIKTLSEKQMRLCTELAKKELLAGYEPQELARILKVRLELAEELQENLSISSDDPPEPAQDIQGELQGIGPGIEENFERIKCSLSLLYSVNRFVEVLGPRLDKLEKEIEGNKVRRKKIGTKILRPKKN
ncbi:hypothetical protein MKW94_029107 [Papaver nudicaule]|uniref:Uncharacterized protein n=1 Tax=Papaver nudicaule TaxID=74823 RepID=A0AA41SDN9_PAPNU|nr:hypothetical protein [Papaver nudicaule]